ncbi:pyridoxamine 5'-phosphate oxidase family protein [Methanosalsum natronophilum]|uniref:Pyridoxamine 5'-phosphate oxidase family protein n=1 Tax=Methanosalsum natronophilum TaxID=768733 RepID=A0A3R7XUK6_9EURY|nr:MAG: pyridoxamine 5'-phosphate oxidase family protein [Methanosalsum natronophilum]
MKADLRYLFDTYSLAALATSDHDNRPYINLVTVAVTQDLKHILFSTNMFTQKYNNISNNPKVSLLLDSRKNSITDLYDAIAVTVIGTCTELGSDELPYFLEIYLNKNPELADFVHSKDNVLFKVEVEKYILVKNFKDVFELNMNVS